MLDEREPRAKRGENVNFQHIIDERGEEFAKSLIDTCPGCIIYVPMSMNKNWKRDYVMKHYNGNNLREMAREMRVTVNNVRKILDSPRPVVKVEEVAAVVVKRAVPYIGRR